MSEAHVQDWDEINPGVEEVIRDASQHESTTAVAGLAHIASLVKRDFDFEQTPTSEPTPESEVEEQQSVLGRMD
jgi:hypothetical protein